MALPEFHLDRARAESFGTAAQSYEAHRPPFPPALLDDLAATGAITALDVGCGTGKVARELARRGLSVVGVELDARMAEVARRFGVPVELARFEEWDDAGRRFDLVACGDAWHWIAPKPGVAKVLQVLRPGGTFVRFWNLQLLEEQAVEALAPVYRQIAPEVFAYGRPIPAPPPNPFAIEGPFSPIEERTYRWERHVTGAEWAAFTGTISDHLRLPPERLGDLKRAVQEALERVGEPVRVQGITTAGFTRHVPDPSV